MAFKAFANDTDILNIQGDVLTVNNDPTRIVVSGTLEVTRDKAGLKAALALQQAINSVVEVLQNEASLPEHIAEEPRKWPRGELPLSTRTRRSGFFHERPESRRNQSFLL